MNKVGCQELYPFRVAQSSAACEGRVQLSQPNTPTAVAGSFFMPSPGYVEVDPTTLIFKQTAVHQNAERVLKAAEECLYT